jgi:two-component system cell cycle sensor histidine kinase/response regulator CckA
MSIIDSFRRALQQREVEGRGPLRVLIVDDEDTVLRFVDRVLSEGGYVTVTAGSGADALARAGDSGPFDMLLTDLMMPGMNGDELARQMRLIQPKLKVLYLTGFSDKLFKEKVTLWEDEAFLDKPCSVRGLLEAVSLLTDGVLPPAAQS